MLRSTWFAQDFDEAFLLPPVLAGVIALPTDVPEPFVDVEDVAAVAVEALTGAGHAGRTYELTGPHSVTFAEAAALIAAAAGRPVRFERVTPLECTQRMIAQGMPREAAEALTDLFARILDGRNAYVTDDVKRVTGHDAARLRRLRAARRGDRRVVGLAGQVLGDHLGQRAQRLAAVADRVLLRRASARRWCGPGPRPGRSGRSRTRPCRAARAAAARVCRPSTRCSRPPGSTSAAAQTNAAAAVLVGHVADLGQHQLEVGLVVAVPAGPAGAEHARHAVERVDREPGVVGDRRQAGARAPSRALISAFSPKVRPVSGTSGYSGTSREPDQLDRVGAERAVQDPLQLDELLRVARWRAAIRGS